MEEKFLAMAKILSFLSIFIAISVRADLLKPNYDDANRGIKVYDLKFSLMLSCNVTDGRFKDLVWKKNGTNLENIEELKPRLKFITAEGRVTIEKSEEKDAGNYSCEITGEEVKNIEVVAKVLVRVPSNTGVVEGEKLSISCTVVGTDPIIYWTHDNETIKEDDARYVLKEYNGVKNAMLTLENVSLTDKGEYNCIGRNKATGINNSTPSTDHTNVRIKGKLAALWPFLGICAEVLILCTIILIYEKRRNKAEMEESDTDQNTEQKKKRRNYD